MTLPPAILSRRAATPYLIARVVGALLALVGITGYLLWLASGVLVRNGNWVAVDFDVYYLAGRALAQGRDIYSAGISPPYVYPPLLAILVLPLAALPATAAIIIWKLLQHVCLLVAGALLVNLLPRGVRPLAVGILLLGWLLVPLQDEIILGESNSLVLLLVVGAIWLAARGVERETQESPTSAGIEVGPPSALAGNRAGPVADRPGDTFMAAAGILLALAASIKVLPLLLVAYFWWRGDRRVALSATAGFVVLQFASLLATLSTARYWLVEFPSLFGQAFPYLDNQSFNAAISRAFLPTDPSLPNMQILSGDLLRPLLIWLANLAALFALFLVFRSRPAPGTNRGNDAYRASLLMEVGLVLLTIHLVSGSTWLHHLVDLAVPICGLLGVWWLRTHAAGAPARSGERARSTTIPLFTLLAVVFVLLLRRPADWLSFSGGLAATSPIIALAISNSALWAVLALWLALRITNYELRIDARNS